MGKKIIDDGFTRKAKDIILKTPLVEKNKRFLDYLKLENALL